MLPLAFVALLLGVFVASSLLVFGPGEAALRMILRSSARLSFFTFLTVFCASPLDTLLHNSFTQRLTRHRRGLGFAFALAHSSAGVCIIVYASLYHGSFMSETYPLQRIGGTVGFAAIAVMVITSFDAVRQRMRAAVWKRTHTLCLWFIFINYSVSFGRRTFLHRNEFYAPFFALLVAALAVRLTALLLTHRRRTLLHERTSTP